MRGPAERAYFVLCLTLGGLLRAARYSKARIVGDEVRKRRAFYAPLLIWASGPLIRMLDASVRFLPRREWLARERDIYRRVYAVTIRIERDGTLVLPRLPGETLADLLEDRTLAEPVRKWAIERAAVALAEFHRLGLTHGDAMAENVLVDIEGGVARWFDFETVHDPARPIAWRRADDVRALLGTCLIRTAPEQHAETLRIILEAYAGGERVTSHLNASFASILRRPLTFHLAQAALSFRSFRELARLLGSMRRE
jgi:tRNA A-37 threonylcarbamoyl transferase component Bud32